MKWGSASKQVWNEKIREALRSKLGLWIKSEASRETNLGISIKTEVKDLQFF